MPNLIDLDDDVIMHLVNIFDNMFDLIQLKMTCNYLHDLLDLSRKCMTAKLGKIHVLRDIYKKTPCWKQNKMLYPQMRRKDELFTFQLGSTTNPVQVVALNGNIVQVQLSDKTHKMLTCLCEKIKKANDELLCIETPTFYINRDAVAHKRKKGRIQKGHLADCLDFELYRWKKLNTIFMASVHVSTHTYHNFPLLLNQPYKLLYFNVHEALIL